MNTMNVRKPASLALASAVTGGLLLLPTSAALGQEPSHRQPAVHSKPAKVLENPYAAIQELMSRALSGQEQVRGQALALPDGFRSRSGLLLSQAQGELLHWTAGDHRVGFFSAGAPTGESRGTWDIAFDSLPEHVSFREFPGGDVIGVARVSDGVQQRLAVGWLRWERTDGSARELRGHRFVGVATISYSVAGTPERVIAEAGAIDSIEVADWDPQTREVSLVLQAWGSQAALEVSVGFSDQDLPMTMTASRPWSTLREARDLEGTWVSAGHDARAITVAGTRFVTQRVRAAGSTSFAAAAPLIASRRTAEGWELLSVLGEVPRVERGYVLWSNRAGELCVSTARTLATPDGGQEQALVSYQLTTAEGSPATWRALDGGAWRGRLVPGARLVVENGEGQNPLLLMPVVEGTPQRVPVSG
jgi:hypothetical protein